MGGHTGAQAERSPERPCAGAARARSLLPRADQERPERAAQCATPLRYLWARIDVVSVPGEDSLRGRTEACGPFRL